MTVTFTTSYAEYLKPETVEYIEVNCIDGEYSLEDALTFIDENSEEEFLEYYDEYIEVGEENGYEAVDAFIKLNSLNDLADFAAAYIGEYDSPYRMAQDYFDGETDRLDYRISIDWEETAEYLLQHDVDRVEDFYFRCSY